MALPHLWWLTDEPSLLEVLVSSHCCATYKSCVMSERQHFTVVFLSHLCSLLPCSLRLGWGGLNMPPPFLGLIFQKLLIFSLWLTVAHYKEKCYYVGINNYLRSILTSYPYSRTAVGRVSPRSKTSLNRFILPDINSYCAASLKPHQKTIGYSHNRYATIGTCGHILHGRLL